MDRFDYTKITEPMIPAVDTLQVDDVELGYVLDGVSYLFRGNILVQMHEEYDSSLLAVNGILYIGESDEDGVNVYWDETDTDCFRLIAMTYEYDDIIKDSVAYSVRYP